MRPAGRYPGHYPPPWIHAPRMPALGRPPPPPHGPPPMLPHEPPLPHVPSPRIPLEPPPHMFHRFQPPAGQHGQVIPAAYQSTLQFTRGIGPHDPASAQLNVSAPLPLRIPDPSSTLIHSTVPHTQPTNAQNSGTCISNMMPPLRPGPVAPPHHGFHAGPRPPPPGRPPSLGRPPPAMVPPPEHPRPADVPPRYGQPTPPAPQFGHTDMSHEPSSTPMELDKNKADHSNAVKPINGELSEKEKQKNADNQWLNNFNKLKNKNHSSDEKMKPQSRITIPRARELMREALDLRKTLENILLEAKNGTDIDDPSSVREEFINVKGRLAELEAMLCDEHFKTDLQARVDRLQRKRTRLKRCRERTRKEQEAALRRREEIETRINQWQADIAHKAQEAKKADELKASADKVLSEVRRKQMDTVKGRDVLHALNKLRDIRCLKMEQRGVQISKTSDDLFRKRLHGMEELLESRLKTYMEEDKALRVIMDMEQEESWEKERDQARKKQQKQLRIYKRNIKEMLYGKPNTLAADDPLYGHRMYYNSGQRHLESFLRIRQDWDVHIVKEGTGGSSVPVGWVCPSQPSDNVWATALKQNQPYS